MGLLDITERLTRKVTPAAPPPSQTSVRQLQHQFERQDRADDARIAPPRPLNLTPEPIKFNNREQAMGVLDEYQRQNRHTSYADELRSFAEGLDPATATYARNMEIGQRNLAYFPPTPAIGGLRTLLQPIVDTTNAISAGIDKLPIAYGGMGNFGPGAASGFNPRVSRVEDAPPVIRFGAQAAPYVAASVATGGAADVAFTAQALAIAADAGERYRQGEISGQQALFEIGMNAGPEGLAPLFRGTSAGARALRAYAESPEGKIVRQRIASAPGKVGERIAALDGEMVTLPNGARVRSGEVGAIGPRGGDEITPASETAGTSLPSPLGREAPPESILFRPDGQQVKRSGNGWVFRNTDDQQWTRSDKSFDEAVEAEAAAGDLTPTMRDQYVRQYGDEADAKMVEHGRASQPLESASPSPALPPQTPPETLTPDAGTLPPHLQAMAEKMDAQGWGKQGLRDVAIPGMEWMNDIPTGKGGGARRIDADEAKLMASIQEGETLLRGNITEARRAQIERAVATTRAKLDAKRAADPEYREVRGDAGANDAPPTRPVNRASAYTLPSTVSRPQEPRTAELGAGDGNPPDLPDTAVAAPDPDDVDGIGLPKPRRNPLPDYEPVQGVDPERAAPRTGEPARLAGDRPRGRDRIGDQLTKDEEQRIEHFAEKARALNAPEPLVRSIVQAYRDAQSFAASANRNVGDAALWQYLAKGRAWVEGGVPDGMISAFARARLVTENALRIHIDGEIARFKGLDKEIADAVVTYKGPPKYRALAEEFQAHALVTHPEWFDGVPPVLAKRLRDLQKFQNDTYKIVEAIDPNAAPALDHPYLRTVWDVPESKLTSAVSMPFGRASVTKKRTFPDPFEAMADKGWPYKLKADLSVEDLINSSAHLSARQIAAQTERKLVLGRFGTTRKRPGVMPFRNANYGGWYAEPEVVNFVDQLHEAAPSTVRNIGNVTGTVRNTVFGVGDIGVFGQHVLNLLSTRGPVAMAGAINRSLEALHLPHMALYLDDQLPRAMARSTDGLVQGGGVYVKRSAGGNKTLPGYLPVVGEGIDDALDWLNHQQFSNALGPLRDMTYEGNLIVNKLLHKTTGAAKFDIGNAAVRRRAAENANAFSGSSLGSFRRARREGEQAFLGAPSITRAMAAELAQVAKLNTPEAWTTLASMAAVVYGMGSLINMTMGSGEPVTFDPRKVDWAMVHVGGEWKDVDGERRYVGGRKIRLIPQSSLVRALGKSVQAVQDGDPARFADAWTQLAFTRSTPLIQNIAAVGGVGFTSDGRFSKDLNVKDRALSALPMPLVGGGIAEGTIDPTDPVDLGTNLIGLSQFDGDDEASVKRDVQGDRRTDIRTKLDEAGFTRIATDAFTSEQGRAAFAEAGMPNEFATIDELREDWIAYGLRTKPETLTEIEARGLLMKKWAQLPIVKRFESVTAKAEARFWEQHPDLLSEAVAAGVEKPDKDETRAVQEYRDKVGAR